MKRSSLSTSLALFICASLCHAQGSVFRVGSSQAFATIQAAVDVASTGDLILVDPGAYPEFVIDGKGLSIAATGTVFEVAESSSPAPAILVVNVSAPDQVTIIGAKINHGVSFDTPAVHLRDNTGAVRFQELFVRQEDDLLGTQARAAMLVENTGTFWLLDSKVWANLPRMGFRGGATGFDQSVNGLEVVDSDGVVQSVRLSGYDGVGTHGGDALRVIGDASVWIIDNLVFSPQRSTLRGGIGDVGGSALHYFGPLSNKDLMSTCGSVDYAPGAGTVQAGGIFAVNGDGGLHQLTGALRLPDACSFNEYNETTTLAPTASIGGTITLRLRSLVPGEFLTFMSVNTSYDRKFQQVRGRLLVDPLANPFLQVRRTVTSGPPVNIVLPVPSQPALIGTQLAFQSLVGPVGAGQKELTFPTFVVLTP